MVDENMQKRLLPISHRKKIKTWRKESNRIHPDLDLQIEKSQNGMISSGFIQFEHKKCSAKICQKLQG